MNLFYTTLFVSSLLQLALSQSIEIEKSSLRSVSEIVSEEATASVTSSSTFNPLTFNWKEIYTGWPQTSRPSSLLVDPFQCNTPFAYCGLSNCTVIRGSKPLVAACGCVNATEYALKTGDTNAFASIGYGPGLLSKEWRIKSHEACADYQDPLKLNNYCVKHPDASPVCRAIDPSQGKNGNAHMFGDEFPLISTGATNIPDSEFSSVPGFPGSPSACGLESNNYYALCFGAACKSIPYINAGGVDKPLFSTTCYCPVYNARAFIFPGNSSYGFNCKGQGPFVKGIPQYVQNGS